MSSAESPPPGATSLHPVFRAVAATVVPESGSLDDDGWAELESLVADWLHRRPASLARQLRLLLGVVQWLPVLRYGRRFTSLDPDRRTRFLLGLQEGRPARLRLGLWGLRTLIFMGYYGRAAGALAIGYRPSAAGWSAYRP